jgi:hypothetical protein
MTDAAHSSRGDPDSHHCGFSFANNLLERTADRAVGAAFGRLQCRREIGQLVVAMLLGGVWVLSQLKLTLPRPITVDVLSGSWSRSDFIGSCPAASSLNGKPETLRRGARPAPQNDVRTRF